MWIQMSNTIIHKPVALFEVLHRYSWGVGGDAGFGLGAVVIGWGRGGGGALWGRADRVVKPGWPGTIVTTAGSVPGVMTTCWRDCIVYRAGIPKERPCWLIVHLYYWQGHQLWWALNRNFQLNSLREDGDIVGGRKKRRFIFFGARRERRCKWMRL